MPKINIHFDVFSNEGFSTKIYRNEAIIGDDQEKFTKKDLIKVLRFIKGCMIGFNKGERGVRYGRNHEQIAKEKKENGKRTASPAIKDPDPRKVREVVRKVEERFKGTE